MPRWLLWLSCLPIMLTCASLTLFEFSNTALAQPAAATSLIDTLAFTTASLSAEALGVFDPTSVTNATIFDFRCTLANVRYAYVFVDDHVICQFGAYNNTGGYLDDLNFTLRSKMSNLVVRAHVYRDTTSSSPASLGVEWCVPAGSQSCSPLPASALDMTLPPPEVERRALQSNALERWGSWLHRDILSVALLPDSAIVIVQLCHLPSRLCLSAVPIDGNGGGAPAVRVGAHALDHSYSQVFVGFLSLNVSIEYAVGGSGGNLDPRSIDLTVTPQGDATDYAIAFAGRFGWGRTGLFTARGDGLSFAGTGLGDVHISVTELPLPPNSLDPVHGPGWPGGFPCEKSSDCASEECTCNTSGCLGICTVPPALVYFAVKFPADATPVGLTTEPTVRISDIVDRIAVARGINMADNARFGNALSSVTMGVTAALGWRNVFVPIEAGPVMPVTYGFSWISPGPTSDDYAYVLFDWDNCFASYSAGVLGDSAKSAAYSNLIQIVRAKTNDGFVPNWASGGSKSQSSEPAVCSRVLLDLFVRFKDAWLVELLLDDLLDWSTWQWDRRRVIVPQSSCCDEPGFISVGNDRAVCDSPADCVGVYKGESGLDQSPKWDCVGAAPDGSGGDCSGFAVNGSNVLQFGEVQSTSLFVADAIALAQLARAVNRTADADKLEARAATMGAQLPRLWDESQKAFADIYAQSGVFSKRLSPTIFYPMMVPGAVSIEQASGLINAHLVNASEFCVTENYTVNPERCYWGLPSISAADYAYMEPLTYVYWRGETWGPMAMLTYWSLDSDSALRSEPVVSAARAALAVQKKAQFLDMWDRNRHVCENASPYPSNSSLAPGTNPPFNKSNAECTGWAFYTWGALNGLLSILEATSTTA